MIAFDTSELRPGENRLPCPECDRGPRDRALSVRREPDGGMVWTCHRCGFLGCERSRTNAPQRPRAPEKHSTLSDYWRELWRACKPLDGEARAYLDARSCAIPPRDSHLRWHQSLKHPEAGYVGPALVARALDRTV
jgi:putative DNA primase/helicase